jgi:hypothetical protein
LHGTPAIIPLRVKTAREHISRTAPNGPGSDPEPNTARPAGRSPYLTPYDPRNGQAPQARKPSRSPSVSTKARRARAPVARIGEARETERLDEEPGGRRPPANQHLEGGHRPRRAACEAIGGRRPMTRNGPAGRPGNPFTLFLPRFRAGPTSDVYQPAKRAVSAINTKERTLTVIEGGESSTRPNYRPRHPGKRGNSIPGRTAARPNDHHAPARGTSGRMYTSVMDRGSRYPVIPPLYPRSDSTPRPTFTLLPLYAPEYPFSPQNTKPACNHLQDRSAIAKLRYDKGFGAESRAF